MRNEKSEKVRPTSGLVELQGDVSVEAQAEVVVEHIQRQLRRQERVTVSHLLHASLQISSLPLRIDSDQSHRNGLLIPPPNVDSIPDER